jgi:hypothetical protein
MNSRELCLDTRLENASFTFCGNHSNIRPQFVVYNNASGWVDSASPHWATPM